MSRPRRCLRGADPWRVGPSTYEGGDATPGDVELISTMVLLGFVAKLCRREESAISAALKRCAPSLAAMDLAHQADEAAWRIARRLGGGDDTLGAGS
jgi:hypothetical protein